jgi:putative ABC transport system permease protein
VTEQFEQLGMSGLRMHMNFQEEVTQADLFRMSDLEIIKSHPHVTHAAPVWEAGGSVFLRNPRETERCFFVGTTDEFRLVERVELIHGRFLAAPDITNGAYVAVIDEALSRRVFGRSNSIGERIRVSFWSGNMELTVVGITKAPEYSDIFTVPAFIHMPVTTLMNLYNTEHIDGFYINVADTERMADVARELPRLISLVRGNENKYIVYNMLGEMDLISDTLGYVTGFVVLVAAISLLVGGIGVMNIMLVTVTERTREIGIRKAIGAKNSAITGQFLLEAILISFIGSMIGMFVGIGLSQLAGAMLEQDVPISIATVILSFTVAIVVGVASGLFPAIKASRLDPIEALRYQ